MAVKDTAGTEYNISEQYPRSIQISRVGTKIELEAFKALLARDNIQLTTVYTYSKIPIPMGSRQWRIKLTFPDASAYTLWTLKNNG